MRHSLGESREHVLHGDVDAPMGTGTIGSVWPIEQHCKAQNFGGLVKGEHRKKMDGLISTIYM